ncbi:MAG: RelA/SpoT domain-containing protein [Pirellulales bacterium]|nr:RelA/SpoT domain-containing protein [Pirellulales bacterium]
MARATLNKRDKDCIQRAVAHFVEHQEQFGKFAEGLVDYFKSHPELNRHIHFIKYRVKDSEHLREKLGRKILDGKKLKRPFCVDKNNVFEMVSDLAGVRIIHLHTDEIRNIHRSIHEIVKEKQLWLVEDATANCWDNEYEKIFKELGIATRSSDSMYTTVHYVIGANRREKITCELQVRTLMDEVWGEVSHRVNYPERSPSSACEDQLKVLARLTTGCARLVDSIFKSHHDAV